MKMPPQTPPLSYSTSNHSPTYPKPNQLPVVTSLLKNLPNIFFSSPATSTSYFRSLEPQSWTITTPFKLLSRLQSCPPPINSARGDISQTCLGSTHPPIGESHYLRGQAKVPLQEQDLRDWSLPSSPSTPPHTCSALLPSNQYSSLSICLSCLCTSVSLLRRALIYFEYLMNFIFQNLA